MKKLSLTATALSAILLFSGCASYNAAPMTPMLTSATSNQEITIVAKKFDEQDCKKFLDRDTIRKGYQPVQLFIQNSTDKNYFFSLDRVGLAHANPSDVARQVHTSTAGRIVGYSVGGLFVWPLLIPAVLDGIKSSDANASLDRDFLDKGATDQIISAHSYFNKLIFVPGNDCPNTFSLTLVDAASNEAKAFVVLLDGNKLNMLNAPQH